MASMPPRPAPNLLRSWFMIEPSSGFAPMEWQSFVGPVLIWRPGGAPSTPSTPDRPDRPIARSPSGAWPASILGRFFAGEKLSTNDVVLLNSYVSHLLDCFGDGSDDESEMRDRMTPEGYADITESFRKDSRSRLNV